MMAPMTKPDPKSKPLRPAAAEQHARFVEMARTVGVDESPDALDKAFDRLAIKTPPKSGQPR
jgi:hypothetical protein